jgi:hypothetical protein
MLGEEAKRTNEGIRSMSKFRKEGLVHTEPGGCMVILDQERLKRLSEGVVVTRARWLAMDDLNAGVWDGYGQLVLGTIVQCLTPVDVVDGAPARVALNYPTGKPSSYFTVTGENFPVSSILTVAVNSAVLTTTPRVNETGGFIFFINMVEADAGGYALVIGANSCLVSNMAFGAVSDISATFMLAPTAPLRVQEGGGLTLGVPAGIARPLTDRIWLKGKRTRNNPHPLSLPKISAMR